MQFIRNALRKARESLSHQIGTSKKGKQFSHVIKHNELKVCLMDIKTAQKTNFF